MFIKTTHCDEIILEIFRTLNTTQLQQLMKRCNDGDFGVITAATKVALNEKYGAMK